MDMNLLNIQFLFIKKLKLDDEIEYIQNNCLIIHEHLNESVKFL